MTTLLAFLAQAALGIALMTIGALLFLAGAACMHYTDERLYRQRVEQARAEGFTEGLGAGRRFARREEQRERFRNRVEIEGPSKN